MRFFIKLIIGFSIFLIYSEAFANTQKTVKQAYLIQNSGWMEPFYTDSNSQFKPLINAIVQATSDANHTITVAAFNQSHGDNISPNILFQGQGGVDIQTYLQSLPIAKKGNALADTDFKEAIIKTITDSFATNEGIIWIFTNNKNSPNNDLQTTERNREFYSLLHLDPAITKTLAFPLKMPVQGKTYQATGLMVYALAYGNLAAQELDAIIQNGRLNQILLNKPARLKPLNQESVRILPKTIKDQTNINISLGNDKKTIILDTEQANIIPRLTLQASIQNIFYPYSIENANVNAVLLSGNSRIPVTASLSNISDLQPDQSVPVEVRIDLPMAQIPSAWSMEALSGMGKEVLIPMQLELTLNNQQLKISPNFSDSLLELFPNDPISEVFTPPATIQSSVANVPLLVRVKYPMFPLIIISLFVLLFIIGGIALFYFINKTKTFYVNVDGDRKTILLKPFKSLIIRNHQGEIAGEIKRGLGSAYISKTEQGHILVLSS